MKLTFRHKFGRDETVDIEADAYCELMETSGLLWTIKAEFSEYEEKSGQMLPRLRGYATPTRMKIEIHHADLNAACVLFLLAIKGHRFCSNGNCVVVED